MPVGIARAGVKSVQQGTIALDGPLSNTATITAVDTAKSFLIDHGSNGPPADLPYYVTLTNATTVTARKTSNTATVTVYFVVVEFN